MASPSIQLLDVVAMVRDLPEHGVRRGQVGTVVDRLGPDAFEVEFVDDGDGLMRCSRCEPSFTLEFMTMKAGAPLAPAFSFNRPDHLSFSGPARLRP